jgi:aminoglycoside phosphotransferase (APT) family kinase protein
MDDIYYVVAHRSQAEIDSFKTRYEDFDTALIPKIFKQAMGLDAVKWERSRSWGSSHVIYFVDAKGGKRPWVLRANTGFNKEPEVMMLIEKVVTDQVSALGVPTNIVKFVDVTRKNFAFDYQIEEMLQGHEIEDHFQGSRKEYDNLSFQLGVLAAKIHTLEYPGFGRFDFSSASKGKLAGSKKSFYDYVVTCLDSDLEYLKNAKIITTNTADRIVDLFQGYKPIINVKQGVLVHHDLAEHNIMFENKKITGIFDWECCVVGDPVLDLASCPTWKSYYPKEEKVLEGYQSVTDLPKDFSEKMKIYKLRTMLWKMVYAIRANILGVENVITGHFYDALAPFGLK